MYVQVISEIGACTNVDDLYINLFSQFSKSESLLEVLVLRVSLLQILLHESWLRWVAQAGRVTTLTIKPMFILI